MDLNKSQLTDEQWTIVFQEICQYYTLMNGNDKMNSSNDNNNNNCSSSSSISNSKGEESRYLALEKKFNTLSISNQLITNLFVILHSCIRSKVRMKSLPNELQTKYKLPEKLVALFSKEIIKTRETLENAANSFHRLIFPRISSFKWRVDVIISTGTCSRVMRPTIVMQMILSNGQIKTFEVSVHQFNQLRHGTAKLLQEMQALQRHPIIKILKDIEKKDEKLRK